MSAPRFLFALLLVAAMSSFGLTAGPSGAETSSRLRSAEPAITEVSWTGVLDTAAPLGCGETNLGCDIHKLVVHAPAGTWITVALDDSTTSIRVTKGDRLMGNAGFTLPGSQHQVPTVTFKQLADGELTYSVAAGTVAASQVNTLPYTATARLAGKAWDREGDCGAGTAIDHLSDAGTAATKTLRVRIVAAPKDEAVARRAGKTVAEIYARIGVPAAVSYDFMNIVDDGGYPYEQVRRHYGGERPDGVDVVHVMTDLFAGGYADCIGGIAYEEKAFSVGNAHYTVQGTVPVDQLPAGLVAAHEIGHLLGAKHEQFNCVEAAPQQAQQPASDGWVGPCTLMTAAGLAASETFSTLERNTTRALVNLYAGRS
jgi:hypothetical protein